MQIHIQKLEIDENGQSYKKSKCLLFLLRSLTLTSFIFKCELIFVKMNVDFCSRGQN